MKVIKKNINFKTEKEKFDLKKIKQEHKIKMINSGFDPKKRLNISEPSILKV